jgi:hypothetical protein
VDVSEYFWSRLEELDTYFKQPQILVVLSLEKARQPFKYSILVPCTRIHIAKAN